MAGGPLRWAAAGVAGAALSVALASCRSAETGAATPEPSARASTAPSPIESPAAAGPHPASREGDTVTPPPVEIPPAIRSYRASRDWDTVAPPIAVRIPAIGVVSELDRLGLDAQGAIEVPPWNLAGWYADGPKPGQDGPAVILGHVDSPYGAAVFARLAELAPGDEVLVDRADGTTVRFAVERLERHPKDAFPTDAVYGNDLRPGLRLITCGGSFDRSTGHYRDNVIVFAVPA